MQQVFILGIRKTSEFDAVFQRFQSRSLWSSENIHARNDTMFIRGFTFYYLYVQSKKVRTANSASNINDMWSVK